MTKTKSISNLKLYVFSQLLWWLLLIIAIQTPLAKTINHLTAVEPLHIIMDINFVVLAIIIFVNVPSSIFVGVFCITGGPHDRRLMQKVFDEHPWVKTVLIGLDSGLIILFLLGITIGSLL